MSPIALRRYRADRMLRQQFDSLRAEVLGTVRGRLRACGVVLDAGDLEACYAQAWQGLYSALLRGQEIEAPAGWLVTVTFRRAVDEHRAQLRMRRGGGEARGAQAPGAAPHRDLAAELDDRAKLRQLFEALRGGLSRREREAAVLCYLQGLSRAQAAAQMGISERRMRKLMEGRGRGRPGVAAKVGALLKTIGAGGWCEEQASLMRGLAYGLLDPQGERYALAVAHRRECPACRAYVVSLRSAAAVLPPPLALPGLAGAVLAAAGAGARAGAGTAAPGAASLQGAGAGALGTAGAGASGAGGSWLLASGGIGAKLAVGCALAIGVGAGCAALGGSAHRAPYRRAAGPAVHPRHAAQRSAGAGTASPPASARSLGAVRGASHAGAGTGSAGVGVSAGGGGAAPREFGPESGRGAAAAAPAARGGVGTGAQAGTVQARAASSPQVARGGAEGAGGGSATPRTERAQPASAGPSMAAREFGVG